MSSFGNAAESSCPSSWPTTASTSLRTGRLAYVPIDARSDGRVLDVVPTN